MEELVDQRVRRFDMSQFLHFRMDHQTRKVIERRFAAPTGDLHKTEAVKSKMLADFSFLSVGNVCELRFGCSQIIIIEIPVLQDLAKLEIKSASGRKRGLERKPSHHVLSHIENGFAGRGMDHFYRTDLFVDRNGRVESGTKPLFSQIDGFRIKKLTYIQCCVIHLAGIDAAITDLVFSGFPGGVCRNGFHRAIFVPDLQLTDGGKPVSVVFFFFDQTIPALVPAIRQCDLQKVFTLLQRYVKRLIRDPGIIVAETG